MSNQPTASTTASTTAGLAADFPETAAVVKADEDAVVNGAVSYLESALVAAQGNVSVEVDAVGTDAENLAFTVANEHGFGAYLSLFKSAIDGGLATVEAAASLETTNLIQEGINKLKAIKAP